MSNIDVKKEFHQFGKYMQIAAILTLTTMAAGMTGLIASIFIFVALRCIKRANYHVNNSSLDEFRSKFIRGFISRICGTAILITGVVNLVFFFLTLFSFIPTSFPVYISLYMSIILIGSGLAFIFLGVAAEMGAWKNLKIFFENNSEMFPTHISKEVIEGCDKLKTGTLLSALGFLIVPGIIGFIFQVQGYFKLATLRKLSKSDAPKTSELQVKLPEPLPVNNLEGRVKFCPNCGAELSGLGRFCAQCGSEIN
ncbi:unnamed protein product [marine sediment metagenome]|uniref:Zinc-ribbon domain-containing protein n=2 Tax=marine sediment metagenome TaxID=412755 RepID=X0ZK44_9ZZZZ